MSEAEPETKPSVPPPAPVAEAVEGGAAAAEDEETNAPAPEEESTAHFEPVVKLEVVETQTGEEDEEVLYSERAKLFVFGETLLDVGTGTKAWKERGVGNVRLLRHKEHQRIRVLMRQEKTHKLIINHALLAGLVLVPHKTSDRSYIWRAEDFSDGENLVVTDFCLRFANSDVAETFKDAFGKHQTEMKELDAGLDKGDSTAADEAADALQALSTKENTPAE